MASFSRVPISQVKSELLEVTTECNLRGLVHSSQWSSELACSLQPSDQTDITILQNLFQKDEKFLTEYDRYCLGKSFFDCKEFARAAFHLKDCQSQVGIFLYFYARYLEIEKSKRYQMVDVLNSNAPAAKNVQEMTDLRNDIKKREDELDGYCYYLYGVVLKALDLIEEAIENLECSIQMQPLFWSSWKELSSLCKDRQSLKEFKVPKHWMGEFFYGHSELELHMNDEALTRYQDISNAGFSSSTYVKSQLATAYYNMRDFEASVEYFKELHTMDPYMLEHIDTYSNILYIQDARAELSYLAHHAAEVDKYRAESCGVIGNYYSLRGEHEKAVLYFKQALRLNPKYIAAWTLLGHEYVELRNASAAIESYRRATEVNRRDYRAWYGLGQTYEILQMPNYSLYYFREAHKLRPNDARMLIALGDTYQNIEKSSEAKKCYLRAVRLGDSEGQATIKIAKLYEADGETKEAAKYFSMFLERNSQYTHSSEDLAEASLFLARHYCEEKLYDDATIYATKAREYTESREEAKSLIAQITELSKGMTIFK